MLVIVCIFVVIFESVFHVKSVLSLLLVFFGYLNENLELALFIIYMYITYRQLFGYGWWGTLWRFAVILLLAVITMIVAVAIIGIYYDNKDRSDALQAILIVSAIAFVLTAIMLFVTHRINKRTYHNNKEILSNL